MGGNRPHAAMHDMADASPPPAPFEGQTNSGVDNAYIHSPSPMHSRWNVAGPQPHWETSFEGHTDWVNDIVLVNDILVSCSNDKTVRIWKGTAHGECQREGRGLGGRSSGSIIKHTAGREPRMACV